MAPSFPSCSPRPLGANSSGSKNRGWLFHHRITPIPHHSFRPSMLLAFNKPYGVLSQFTPDGSSNRPLAGFGFPKNVYPIGRLDADSEGLLLLSDEPELNEKLLHPRHAHEREYWVQVERIPERDSLERLARGIAVQGRKTLPSRAWILEPQPKLAPRVPPIRF